MVSYLEGMDTVESTPSRQQCSLRKVTEKNMNNKYYPMNSAEVLDQVLDVYKRSFFKQLAISIVFSIIFFIIFYIFLLLGLVAAGFVIFANYFTQATISAGGIIVIAVFILLFLLGISIYGALLYTGNALITKQTFLGEYCDVTRVIKMAFKKLWITTTASLANLIILIPAIIVMALFVFLYITMLIEFFDIGMGVMPIIIMSIVLILLVIAFFVLYITTTMMSVSVAIFEGKYFFSALKRGFELVQPDFLKLMGLVAIWFTITSVFSYSFEVFFGVGSAIGLYFLPQEAAALMYMGTTGLRMILSIIISTILMPLSGIFYTMVYINQRIKHEALDVELNLNALRRPLGDR